MHYCDCASAPVISRLCTENKELEKPHVLKEFISQITWKLSRVRVGEMRGALGSEAGQVPVLPDVSSPWALSHHRFTSGSDPLTQRSLLWETAQEEDPSNSWHLVPGQQNARTRRQSRRCLTPGETVPIREARLQRSRGVSVSADGRDWWSVEP